MHFSVVALLVVQRSEFKASGLHCTLTEVLTFPVAETLLIEMMVSSGVQMNANTPDTLLCFAVEGSSASEESMMVVALK